MRGFVAERAAGGNPLGHPVVHLSRRYSRIAEKLVTFCRVVEQRDARLFACERCFVPKPLCKLFRDPASAEGLRSGEIENEGWRGAVRDRPHADGVCVALPDDVDQRHSQIDRPPLKDGACYIDEYTVTKIDRVVEP